MKVIIKLRPRLNLSRLFAVAFLIASAIPSSVLGDEAKGCKAPQYWPNPMCFPSPSGTGCIKWVHYPPPSSCDGGPGDYVCFEFKVTGPLTVYTSTTANHDCACDSNDWEPAGGGTADINQAYNNDTQCQG